MNLQKYNYINFVKEENDQKSHNNNLNGECIKKFYQELVSEPTNELSKKNVNNQDETQIIKKKVQSNLKDLNENKKHIKKDEFLKAAQDNKLNIIQKYIDYGFDINILDSYNWSALMIAVAAQNFDIVKLLLNNNADVTIEDNSGNNAYKLAIKVKNDEIKNLIVKKALSIEDTDEESIEIENDQDTLEYCKLCDKQYSKLNEKSHLTSIVHIINENKNDVTKLNHGNYTLKSTNKGYQMLVKSGWNELTGLGINEQGRIYPIKASKKEDRCGLGMENKKKKYSINSVFNKNGKFSSKTSVFKSIKEIKKNNDKLKHFERKFRQYFDS